MNQQSVAEPVLPGSTPPSGKKRSGKRKRKWIKWVVIGIVMVLLTAFLLRACNASKSIQSMLTANYRYDMVARRDINMTLSGSGALQPADSYNVSALVTGEILNAPFEEGDVVTKGDLLYEFDPSDAQTGIERAQLSLERTKLGTEQTQKSIDDLVVKAPDAGILAELNVEAGDTVQAGQQIGTVRDSRTMVLELPFNAADAPLIWVGQSAAVTLEQNLESLTGTVTKVNTAPQVLTGGMSVCMVTIEVVNPGALSAGASATAKVSDIACNSAGTFAFKSETPVMAKASGEVAKVNAKEGSPIGKNDAVITLKSDDLQNSVRSNELSIRDSELSLESQREQLENYTVTSPISGTVIQKNYKAGDKLAANAANGMNLCVIYDLTYLTMTLNVDEWDISSVELGQKVAITAEAVEGKAYEGTVTKINIQGNTANGVTTYPVTIQIDQADGLLPGMNVNANIVVKSAANVLCIPTAAVSRGNQVLVSTQSEAGIAAAAAQTSSPSDSGKNTENRAADGIPEGYIWVPVTLGLSDDDYIEITGGLAEGDAVAYAGASGQNGMYGFMGGGMMGPGMGGGMDNVTVAPAGRIGG